MSPLPLEIAVKATLLLAAAGVVQAFMRRRASAAARHLLWTLAIVGVLLLPVASGLEPRWSIDIPLAHASAAAPAAGPLAAVEPLTREAFASQPNSTASTAMQAAASTDRRVEIHWLALVTALYLAGLVLLLARLAAEQLALGRLVRASRPIIHPAWQRALQDAARLVRCAQPVRLLQSDLNVMPMTFGSRRPIIVMPLEANRWAADRRRAVLLHELAHVARRDCLTQLFAAVACAVYWPHPGIWWAARRLRVERELACHDRVLDAGTDARDYAGHLLEIAHAFGASPARAVALGMARARQLEGRLLAVLDTARNRAAPHRSRRLILVAASMMLFVPLTAVRATVTPIHAADARGARSPQASPSSSGSASLTVQDLAGAWEIRLRDDGVTVQLTLRTLHSSEGRELPLVRLEGLTAAQITGGGMVRFTSRREAGTFTFDGVCRSGVCGGTYGFAANPAFAAELAKRGIGTPTAAQQFDLAMADVGVALVDELNADGYARPDVEALVRTAQHGADLEYVRGMAGLGYRVGTVDALIRLRDHGVDPAFVRGLAAQGLTQLPPDALVRARDHGVDPEYVRGMRDVGQRSLTLEQLVAARDHGVDPRFVGDLASLGYKDLPLDALVGARDHGVDPTYVRAMQGFGYHLALADLTRARDHGVDPNYVRDMAGLGYKDVPLDALIRMRDHGVDPAYVRGLAARGIEHLSVDELIRRRDRGGDDLERPS